MSAVHTLQSIQYITKHQVIFFTTNDSGCRQLEGSAHISWIKTWKKAVNSIQLQRYVNAYTCTYAIQNLFTKNNKVLVIVCHVYRFSLAVVQRVLQSWGQPLQYPVDQAWQCDDHLSAHEDTHNINQEMAGSLSLCRCITLKLNKCICVCMILPDMLWSWPGR